jgi:hypothetical protein
MNAAVRLEVLVEEESAERLLRELVPRIVPEVGFEIRTFQGKPALLRELPKRMQGYAQVRKFEPGLKVLILVDRDDDDCLRLKARLEKIVSDVGLASLSSARGGGAVVATRIAVEELEAWIFGDVRALQAEYPKIPSSLDRQARYRDPDAIAGGTWEALQRVLQNHGYHPGGLPKILLAQNVARHMDVDGNRSRSFVHFRDGIRRLVDAERVA